jgi:hypothetical protein
MAGIEDKKDKTPVGLTPLLLKRVIHLGLPVLFNAEARNACWVNSFVLYPRAKVFYIA